MPLLPNSSDRQPQSARFWVGTETENLVVTSEVRDSAEDVEERLERVYPLYRALQVGKRVVATMLSGGEREV